MPPPRRLPIRRVGKSPLPAMPVVHAPRPQMPSAPFEDAFGSTRPAETDTPAQPTGPDMPELLTTRQVAAFFQVSERTIRDWRAKGLLKPYRITLRTVLYRKESILSVLE